MLKCLFMKRKLYDYLEDSLSGIDKIKVKRHLDSCSRCNQSLSQMKNIIALASEEKSCKPNAEFWHNFQVELDRKLNEKLVPPLKTQTALTYRLRPLFAYAAILLFILATGSFFYKKPHHLAFRQIARDEELADEWEALEEVTESELSQDKDIYEDDPYLEELRFLSQLDEEVS